MKSSRPNDIFLNWLTDCIVATRNLTMQFPQPQAARQLSVKTNFWSIGVRAKPGRLANQGDSIASTASFRFTERNHAKNNAKTEVWLPQVWLGELAELTGYSDEGASSS